ncbi:acyl-lipid (9-3)-desaturase-like [Carex rostrata]
MPPPSLADEGEKKGETTTFSSALPLITSDELRLHNTATSLWLSIHGLVYDVTKWVPLHPGGDLPLLSFAGRDATDPFLAYHPSSVHSYLTPYLIGRLSDRKVSPTSLSYRNLIGRFTSEGLFQKKGLVFPVSILATFLLLLTSVSLVIFVKEESFFLHLLAGLVMGCCWIQSGWLGHDSGHYQVIPNPRLNRIVQILTGNCLAGISIAWWKRNHNAHHIACNSLDHDPDLQHMPFFAVSSRLFSSIRSYFYERTMKFDPFSKFLISYQHITFYPVMGFARINLFAQSIILLLTKKNIPDRGIEILGVLLFWVWYPMLVSCLPNWGERIAFVIASFNVTGIQHVQFCLNHFSSVVYLGAPGGNDWFEKQTMGSLNISCSPYMDWFHGGLQFQIEHHLFPRLPRCHLRRVSPFVKELCKKHNLPYDIATFWEANVRTVNSLRAAAIEARKVGSGNGRNLVWEAVNTHG